MSFGTGPQIGEAVAGDVVNTTSRMQGLAPHGSVVIGETTVRAVQGQFELEALPPATVKGKADPIHVWRVLGERTGPPAGEMPSFVGRRHELRLLGQLFDRVVASATGQLVTVVGEPGMGKTRLVEEFRGVVEGRARWLAGRCLPYGESVTFAPAADMVREVAGFGAADDPARVRDALATLVADLRQDDEDGRRLLSVLRTIVGAQAGEEAPSGTDPIPPSEVAGAWARVVGSLAAPGPLVLHLEDLHWADEVLLDVIEQVAGAMADRAVLNLCTARPELLDRHPGWGAGRVNTTSLGLAPLSRQETGELLSDPLTRPSISDATRESLLERSGAARDPTARPPPPPRTEGSDRSRTAPSSPACAPTIVRSTDSRRRPSSSSWRRSHHERRERVPDPHRVVPPRRSRRPRAPMSAARGGERDRLARTGAPPRQPPRAPLDDAAELFHQPRLPHPRFAHDGDQLPCGGRDHARWNSFPQQPQVVPSTRRRRRLAGRRPRSLAADAPDIDRIRLSPHSHRGEHLELEAAPAPRAPRLADHHRAVRHQSLHPRCGVDDVAGDGLADAGRCRSPPSPRRC